MPAAARIGPATAGWALPGSRNNLFGHQEYARGSLGRRDRDIRWPEAGCKPHKVQHGKHVLWQRQDAVQVGERLRTGTHRVPGACLPLLRRRSGHRISLGSCRSFPHQQAAGPMHVMMSSVVSSRQDRIEQREAVPVDCNVTLGTSRPVKVRRGEREGEERHERDERRPAQRSQPGASRRNVRCPDATEQPGPSCPIYPVSVHTRSRHRHKPV